MIRVKIRYLLTFGTLLIFFPIIFILTIHKSSTVFPAASDSDAADGSSSSANDNGNNLPIDNKSLEQLLRNVQRISGQNQSESFDLSSDGKVRGKLVDAIASMVSHIDELNKRIADNNLHSLPTDKSQVKIINPSLLELSPAYLKWSSNTTLEPKFHIGKTNPQAKFIFGVPTVSRKKESYLLPTLQNLFDNLTPAEKSISQFIVFIGETKEEVVQAIIDDITEHFQDEIDSGLLEIISPPEDWYPDMGSLRQTLNDPEVRVKWRTKQNLDFAYLWLWAKSKPGMYYVQLEDDIVSKGSYVLEMMNFIKTRTASNPDWIVLDFCSLGFIGKLFRVSDLLGFLVQYLLFFNDKPVDWLLSDYFRTKICSLDDTQKKCNANMHKYWVGRKPSLFQHIGTYSSLDGKVQKLKDKLFSKEKVVMKSHNNPEAAVNTTLKMYMDNSFENIYLGKGIFWAFSPIENDYLRIIFKQPQSLKSIMMSSGNYLHPRDIFPGKTTFELRKENSNEYIPLGKAVQSGKLSINISQDMNPVAEICVRFNENATSWLLINEIEISK